MARRCLRGNTPSGEPDLPKFIEFATLAARQGNADGQQLLGSAYCAGDGVGRDWVAAVKWHKLAARQGCVTSMNDLGNIFFLGGNGIERDQKTGIAWYEMGAEQGEKTAQYNLGLRHLKGDGVPKDPKQARHWFAMSAEQNYDDASWKLGVMLVQGQGGEQCFAKGFEQLERAAARGNAGATAFLEKIRSAVKKIT